ncbi:MAG: response regulator [bacterium]|nr:response regulator [bacterium]
MRRVLFVDDEPKVLDGLRRLLRSLRKEWQMEFVTSGAEGLQEMEKGPFDIVVADMKMPGMDGAELLSLVKERYPDTIRIILSAQTGKEALLRSIGSTHQFLHKPCDPEQLKWTIRRAERLRGLLGNQAVRSLIARADSLPALPDLFQQVVAELQKPNASLRDVGKLIGQDPGMSTRILQVVNSPFFGLRRPMTDVERATAYIGLDTTNAIVLGVSVFAEYEDIELPGFSVRHLWEHSLLTSRLARLVAEQEGMDSQLVEDAGLAGTLHDTGKLLLANHARDEFRQVLIRVAAGDTTFSAAETELLGTNHAEVGAYLAGRWGLSDGIIEAIAYHNHPGDSDTDTLDLNTVVHVASALAVAAGSAAPDAEPPDCLDMTHLQRLGIDEHWPRWCEATAELLEVAAS